MDPQGLLEGVTGELARNVLKRRRTEAQVLRWMVAGRWRTGLEGSPELFGNRLEVVSRPL